MILPQFWRATQAATAGLLVIPLRHAYSEDGLRSDWLKGTDRAQAEVLFTAAGSAGLEAYLALVTYWVVGEPKNPYDEDEPPANMVMCEIFEEELLASAWMNATGTAVPLGPLPVEPRDFLDGYDTLIKEVAKEENEGYTGNEGMELTRWYHRAAMILWHPGRTGALLTAAGVAQAIAALDHRQRHPCTGGATAADIARAALERWIRDGHPGHGAGPAPGHMATVLAAVADAALAMRYLDHVLVADPNEQPAPGLDVLFDRCGAQILAPAFAAVWSAISARSLRRDAAILARIAARREAICRHTALAGAQVLVHLAVTRPTQALPHGVAVLMHLAQALGALQADALREDLFAGLTPERADRPPSRPMLSTPSANTTRPSARGFAPGLTGSWPCWISRSLPHRSPPPTTAAPDSLPAIAGTATCWTPSCATPADPASASPCANPAGSTCSKSSDNSPAIWTRS